jgi:hypothetical protein
MKVIKIIIAFIVLIIAAPLGFIWENICAGFYYGQLAARKTGEECKHK